MESEEDKLYNYHLTVISFFDQDGNEITENFKIADNDIKDLSSGVSTVCSIPVPLTVPNRINESQLPQGNKFSNKES